MQLTHPIRHDRSMQNARQRAYKSGTFFNRQATYSKYYKRVLANSMRICLRHTIDFSTSGRRKGVRKFGRANQIFKYFCKPPTVKVAADNLNNHQIFGTRRVCNQCLYCGSQAIEHSERYYPQFRHSPQITSCIAR